MTSLNVQSAVERFTTFGDLLKYLRRGAGLTQRELSIAVGYSEAQISRLEQNERLPDLTTIAARFLPVLQIKDQPELAERLLELAAKARREDAPAVGLPPYKGLYYFQETDADLFFGRETLIKRLVDEVLAGLANDQRFLAVIGASGSGKSSALRAGLAPALRWRPPSAQWPMHIFTPTAHPLAALAQNLAADQANCLDVNTLTNEMRSRPTALQDCLARLQKDSSAWQQVSARHTLLIIDQFEELFTVCRNESDQAAFIANLLSAAFQPGGAAVVVIGMRADFYAHCARFDHLREALSRRQVFIGPMTPEELRRAIEEPARSGNWEIEPGLTEVLLHDVGADSGCAPEPGALPLLSHALLETWRRRRGRTLTLSGYTASGGVRGAITETAEAVYYDQLDGRQREVARQIFLRLTELGEDTSTADTRRRVSFAELSFKLQDSFQGTGEHLETGEHLVQGVLKTLADARLVTIDQDTAEVAHEALIRAWPTLRGWLEEDREGLRLHRRLTEAAQDWHLAGREPSSLYRGARLAQALEWSRSHADNLNLLERTFLEASQTLAEREANERDAHRLRELQSAQRLAETERARAEEQAQANRRLRRQAWFLVVAFLLAGIFSLAAFLYSQRAVQAERLSSSRELAGAALNNLSVDPERSVLLALQALQVRDTLEARNALHRALPELHIQRTIPAHLQASGVAYSPDGRRLASIGAIENETKIWDAATGELLATLAGETGSFGLSVEFSPDGKRLASTDTAQVTVWEAASGEKLLVLPGDLSGPTVVHISFSPDGRWLAVANLDGKPKIWDLENLAGGAGNSDGAGNSGGSFSLDGHAAPCDGIAFSPDGRYLASGDESGIVKIWETANWQAVHSFGQGGVIHSVNFSPNSQRLAAANEDGSLKVWDVANGKELLSLPRLSGLYDVIFLPGDQQLATAHQDGVVRVWDAQTGQLLLTLAGHASTVVSLASHPYGGLLASSGYDGSVRIWNLSPGKEVLTLAAHADQAWDVAYSPDGSTLATVGLDGKAFLWEPESGRLLHSLQPGAPLTSLAFSPDGQILATGSLAGEVHLWQPQTGELLGQWMAHAQRVGGLAFSPDGRRLVSAGWDGVARVWQLAAPVGLAAPVRLAAPGQHSIGGDPPQLVTEFSGHTKAILFGVAFSPDGKTVYTAGEFNARAWDAASGKELQGFHAGGLEVYGLALSPDGELLAMGLQNGQVLLWDLASHTQIAALTGHTGLALRLAFSADGSHLASASFDGYAKVWEVASKEELFTLYGNASNVFGVAFSPDGRYLATSGGDGSLRIFTLRLPDLIALAQTRLQRGLSSEECMKFLHTPCP